MTLVLKGCFDLLGWLGLDFLAALGAELGLSRVACFATLTALCHSIPFYAKTAFSVTIRPIVLEVFDSRGLRFQSGLAAKQSFLQSLL